MARPKKDTNIFCFRFPTVQCTADELATAKQKAKATGLSFSEYARQTLTTGKANIVVNDNRHSSFEHALANYFKADVGKQLNTMAHRANSSSVLPRTLKSCLMRLLQDLDYLHYIAQICKDYGGAGEGRISNSIAPIFDFSFSQQLSRVGINLIQLIRIAEQTEDSRLEILNQCYRKLEPLIDSTIAGLK